MREESRVNAGEPADLVLKLLEGYTTPAVVAAIPRVQAVLDEMAAPVSAVV